MKTKICTKCGVEKSINEFYFRNKNEKTYRNQCKVCCNKANKEYNEIHKSQMKQYYKKYREEHAEKHKKYAKEYYKEHKEHLAYKKKILYYTDRERILNQKKKYIEEHKNEIKLYKKQYYEQNKDKIKEYNELYKAKRNDRIRKRRLDDDVFKIKEQIKCCIRKSFRRKGMNKSRHTEEIVGISLNKLYVYLLDTFRNNYGYDWDGKEEVHIDHIKPLSTANTEEDVIKLCHYTNLQLLKGLDNIQKSDNLDWILTKQD